MTPCIANGPIDYAPEDFDRSVESAWIANETLNLAGSGRHVLAARCCGRHFEISGERNNRFHASSLMESFQANDAAAKPLCVGGPDWSETVRRTRLIDRSDRGLQAAPQRLQSDNRHS